MAWEHQEWTGGRLKAILGSMREAAAPGVPVVPIAVWKAMPQEWGCSGKVVELGRNGRGVATGVDGGICGDDTKGEWWNQAKGPESDNHSADPL